MSHIKSKNCSFLCLQKEKKRNDYLCLWFSIFYFKFAFSCGEFLVALFTLQIDFQIHPIIQSVLMGVAAYPTKVAGEVSSGYLPLLICGHVACSPLYGVGQFLVSLSIFREIYKCLCNFLRTNEFRKQKGKANSHGGHLQIMTYSTLFQLYFKNGCTLNNSIFQSFCCLFHTFFAICIPIIIYSTFISFENIFKLLNIWFTSVFTHSCC